jgi:hypothetical protein
MSHHGREDEVDRDHVRSLEAMANRYGTAVELIKAIANGLGEDGSRAHGGGFATTTPAQACDNWLEHNGMECEASRRRQRERRAEQLDAEIERLRAERAAL